MPSMFKEEGNVARREGETWAERRSEVKEGRSQVVKSLVNHRKNLGFSSKQDEMGDWN